MIGSEEITHAAAEILRVYGREDKQRKVIRLLMDIKRAREEYGKADKIPLKNRLMNEILQMESMANVQLTELGFLDNPF